jgi:hypothetical protein
LIGAESMFVSAPQPRRLAVSLREGTASISGITAGGRVLVYRRSNQTIHFASSRVQRDLEIVVDEDRDGSVDVDVDLETSAHTLDLLLFVDLAARDALLVRTGENATAERSVESLAIRREADPRAGDHLIDRTKWLDLVLILGSGSVLAGDAHDGGLADADATVNGWVELALDDLHSVDSGNGAADANSQPVRLEDGDLVFVVDPRNLAASLLVVRRRRA